MNYQLEIGNRIDKKLSDKKSLRYLKSWTKWIRTRDNCTENSMKIFKAAFVYLNSHVID